MKIQICPICKSAEIQQKAWVNVNTNKVIDTIEEDYVWCEQCELSVEPINFNIKTSKNDIKK